VNSYAEAVKVRLHVVRAIPILLAFLGLAGVCAAGTVETLSHGRFHDVKIQRPDGDPRQVVLMLSDGAGWNGRMDALAGMLAADGALVVGIDLRSFVADLEGGADDCTNPDGDLENLAHFVEAYYELPTYRAPLLVGDGQGATFAYAMLAKARAGIFAGALSLGFCPHLKSSKPVCVEGNLHYTRTAGGAGMDLAPAAELHAPWIVLRATDDPRCALDATREFVGRVQGSEWELLSEAGKGDISTERSRAQLRSAVAELSRAPAPGLPLVPAHLGDLPLVEVAAHGSVDALAIFISGDGGWAGLDERVAAAIAARGIPVVGLDSLRYFWKARTPQSAAADVDRTLRYYLAHWKKNRALLVGYSQGANVLPFIVNRLPPAMRQRVVRIALLGLGQTASFEFHLSNWVSKDDTGLPIRPEMEKLAGVGTLCLYGEDEGDSLCPQLAAGGVELVKLPGGHHFGGDYEGLAARILRGIVPDGH
jgi:type IV secretory pathway VirJ component